MNKNENPPIGENRILSDKEAFGLQSVAIFLILVIAFIAAISILINY